MKKAKKKLLILLSSCALVALMLFNVSVSMEDTGITSDISLAGMTASALALSDDQDSLGCAWLSNCDGSANCGGVTGEVTGCEIECSDGASVTCPERN